MIKQTQENGPGGFIGGSYKEGSCTVCLSLMCVSKCFIIKFFQRRDPNGQ